MYRCIHTVYKCRVKLWQTLYSIHTYTHIHIHTQPHTYTHTTPYMYTLPHHIRNHILLNITNMMPEHYPMHMGLSGTTRIDESHGFPIEPVSNIP